MPSARNTMETASDCPSIDQVAHVQFGLMLQQVGEMLRKLESTTPNTEERSKLVVGLLGIMEAHPELTTKTCLLTEENLLCGSALVGLLRAGEGLDSIQRCCNICPDLKKVLDFPDSWGHYPLDWACMVSDPQVVDYMVRAASSLHLSLHSHGPLHFEPLQLAMMNPNGPIPTKTMKLLIQDGSCQPVRKLSFHLALLTEQPRSLCQAMEDTWSGEIPETRTMKKLTITIPIQLTPPELTWFSQCLQRCLRNNNNLYDLTVQWEEYKSRVGVWTSLLRAMRAGLNGNQTINRLRMENYRQGDDDFYATFFSRKSSEHEMCLYMKDKDLNGVTGRPNQLLADFLQQSPAQAITHLDLVHARPEEDHAISVDAILAFLKNANSLRSLHLSMVIGWDCNGVQQFFAALQKNQTLRKVGGIKMPEQPTTQELEGLSQSIQLCLRHNETLQDLTLHMYQSDPAVWARLVQAILAGLKENETIRKLELRSEHDDSHPSPFTAIFSFSRGAPEYKMELFDKDFIRETNRPNQLLADFLRLSPAEAITHLDLQHGRPPEEETLSVDAVLKFLEGANSLRYLDLKMDVGWDYGAFQRFWDYGAFRRFLEAIEASQSLTKVHAIKVPEPLSPQEQDGPFKSIRQCLQNNNTLEDLTLQLVRQSNPAVWILLVQEVQAGLAGNQTLNHLCLENWIPGHCDDGDPEVKFSFSHGKLTSLHLDARSESQFVADLLRQIPAASIAANIRELQVVGSIDQEREIPVSIPIPAFLAGAPLLQSLNIEDHKADGMAILEALKIHRSIQTFCMVFACFFDEDEDDPIVLELAKELRKTDMVDKCLEMVENDNRTLTECAPWSDADDTGRIEYYLALNHFGRAQIGNADATGQNLLVLLLKVQQPWDDDLHFPYLKENNALGQSNMLYGLLRETPGIWGGGGSSMAVEGNSIPLETPVMDPSPGSFLL